MIPFISYMSKSDIVYPNRALKCFRRLMIVNPLAMKLFSIIVSFTIVNRRSTYKEEEALL